MISQMKCNLFSYFLFIFLIYIKICKPVETNAEINKPSGNINNIENLNKLKKLYFHERFQSNDSDPLPINKEIPPPSISKSSSSFSRKQKYVSSTKNESTKTQQLKYNFGKKHKSDKIGLHKMNLNVDSSIISPGVFYRKFFSTNLRSSQRSNAVEKFNDSPTQLTEQKYLKNRTMIYPLNIINKFGNPKSTTYTDQQKYSFSGSKKSDNLFEDVLDPEFTNIGSF